MAQTLRLHVFLPANSEGIIPPASIDDPHEFAVHELFSEYFSRSSYASLRNERPDIVSQIFEEREDNLGKIDELERKLREWYPEADVLRIQDDSELYDLDGPEWEYNSNIFIQIANQNLDSPQIRWQYGNDIFGKQLTPPGAVASGLVALTDGSDLWGIDTESGNSRWSVTIPQGTSRSPVLVKQMVIMESGSGHVAYNIESGEKLWVTDDLPTTSTTRHKPLNEHCYFGDFDGAIWELSSAGDHRAVAELGERIISVCPTEERIYALMRGEGKSGRTPETLHAIDRTTGDEQWVFEPEKTLNRVVAAGPEHIFVSTREKIFALQADSGNSAWVKPPSESNPDEKVGSTTEDENSDGSNRDDDAPSWKKIDDEGREWGELSTGKQSRSMSLAAPPIVDDALFAPTREGVHRIEPSTGDVTWKTAITGSASPPTHDRNHIYIAIGDSVCAIEKEEGEIVWEFETPGNPGTVTFDPNTKSLTFITRGSAINVDPYDVR